MQQAKTDWRKIYQKTFSSAQNIEHPYAERIRQKIVLAIDNDMSLSDFIKTMDEAREEEPYVMRRLAIPEVRKEAQAIISGSQQKNNPMTK